MTCSSDETVVLCTRCFEASDHTDHDISHSLSSGNSGCCDCGDEEAWERPVECAIHTANSNIASGKQRQQPPLPEELRACIGMTIGRALDYLIDVVSCSPENLRLHKTQESIQSDEETSRLGSVWYEETPDPSPEYALILWNDEKHTVMEVAAQVARACHRPDRFGMAKAEETNDYGRSVVEYSKNIPELLRIAEVIEQIKITVTIRSSRDTFREQMCGTIVEWLHDITGCSVGDDHGILRQTICRELLKTWRLGSEAVNKNVGQEGLDDHAADSDAELAPVRLVTNVVHRRDLLATFQARAAMGDSDSDSAEDEGDEQDDEQGVEQGDVQQPTPAAAIDVDQMDVDPDHSIVPNTDVDLEMRTPNDMEDGEEVSEAAFAGYPPPPPPPPAPAARQHTRGQSIGSQISEPLANISFAPFVSRTNIDIPPTRKTRRKKILPHAPPYWLQQPERSGKSGSSDLEPLEEDLLRRIRLDWLLLYDLRLWKKVRIDIRDLYIQTLITNPPTKRIFGLRFAGLYNVLGQLYLIADREPDHSILNLSLQMFTTPSVVFEVIERGNFLTILMSMLYTFLTQRNVQQPWQVSVEDSMMSESNSVSNRRMYHFFSDLRHIFGSDHVKQQLRTQERYQLQFLDLIRLPQGICPNNRAVGEHVEYENDIWISAQILTKEINRLVRQFAETFHVQEDQVSTAELSAALRLVAKAAVINSMGGERQRFALAEIKTETQFRVLEPFLFESTTGSSVAHSVVEFVVEKEAISFHHPLHYTLSWLVEAAKSLPLEQLRKLLTFNVHELRRAPPYKALISDQIPENYLMALFDFPIRVCAWLAQMKAGMWVRNGLSLRHQMITYKGAAYRDLAHHRDIFMIQTALVVCDPSRVLATMIDRFGLEQWMRGEYVIRKDFEASQQLDVAEDFIHLFIIVLSDRLSLQPSENPVSPQVAALRRDIAHTLCFKPLSYSDLESRLADKPTGCNEFPEILDTMTTFKPPEGLSDTGMFELKSEYRDQVDPYAAFYSKNQRDEAENAYRKWRAQELGKPAAEVVYEPKLDQIQNGIFVGLATFTQTPLFAQLIFHSLSLSSKTYRLSDVPATRFEAYLHIVLHLVLIAVMEDHHIDKDSQLIMSTERASFIKHALDTQSELGLTILDLLVKLLEVQEVKNCHSQIRLILYRMRQKRPQDYQDAVSRLMVSGASLAPDYIGFESPLRPGENELEARQQEAHQQKKKEALERQARVMAQFQQQQQNFINNQDMSDWNDGDNPLVAKVPDERTPTWKYPSGNCILCQEETNEARLYGTFGMMMNSTVFRQTDVRNDQLFGEVLSTPISLDRSATELRPFGVAGQNRSRVVRRGLDGRESTVEQQGLAKGFPHDFVDRGPVSTGCGHIMHYSCFDQYCAATQRRQTHQIARQHPERTALKEFICPLCKALGNSFLPIIWNGKEETEPAFLQTSSMFQEWLSTRVGLAVSRVFKSQEGKSSNERLREQLARYVSKTLKAPLKDSVLGSDPRSQPPPTSSSSSSRRWSLNFPGFRQSDLDSMHSLERTGATDSTVKNDLLTIYNRLRDSMKANGLFPEDAAEPEVESHLSRRLSNPEILVKMLGRSIASAEIAQRGEQAGPGQTLISRLSSASLTHLRILSETVSSYTAVGIITSAEHDELDHDFFRSAKSQVLQLFTGLDRVRNNFSDSMEVYSPALSQDAFVLLTEYSVVMAPVFHMEISHVIRLCYILELVKVIIYVGLGRDDFESLAKTTRPTLAIHQLHQARIAMNATLGFLAQKCALDMPVVPETTLEDENIAGSQGSSEHLLLLYQAVSKYALAFLRKVVIFMHVKYGMNFFRDVPMDHQDSSELDRLTNCLGLPSLTAMLHYIGQSSDKGIDARHAEGANDIQAVIAGWILDWKFDPQNPSSHLPPYTSSAATKPVVSAAVYKALRPGHPGIFELIGLPKYYDTLTYEVTRHRCPTKGGKLEDPSLCLFCGEFFCGQALCCSKAGKGGCNQHMQK